MWVVYWGFPHSSVPSGTNIAIENCHRNSGFAHWKWWIFPYKSPFSHGFPMVFPWFTRGEYIQCALRSPGDVRGTFPAGGPWEVGGRLGAGFLFCQGFWPWKMVVSQYMYHNMWYLWYLWYLWYIYIYIYSQKWFHYRFTIKNGRSTLANGRFHYVSLTGAPYINLKSGSSGVKNRGLTYGTFSFKSDLTRKRCLEFDGPMGSPLSQISISWGYFLRCIINTIWRDSLGYIMDMDIYIYIYIHTCMHIFIDIRDQCDFWIVNQHFWGDIIS